MVRSFAVVGGQNGDEGKGKDVDYIAFHIAELLGLTDVDSLSILNYRWQGGPNAGHTVRHGDRVFKLHQLPSGIVRNSTYTLLGTGMFLNPRKLKDELETLQSEGIQVSPERMGISSKAHMILDYHVHDDAKNFNRPEHSSTGNGIKQTARTKADREGMRFIEFLDPVLMKTILKEKVFPDGMPGGSDYDSFVKSYDCERSFLEPYAVLEEDVLTDPRFSLHLAEGAQGVLLDLDVGQYPGTTSSNPVLPHHRPAVYIGVFKMYVSSVGIADRPFVSEMSKDLQAKLVDVWGEYGTTTGKPRHIGWFDAVAAEYAVRAAHMDYAAASCLDKLEYLAKLDEPVRIVTGYEIDGRQHTNWHVSFDRRDTLYRAKPIFETLPSWDQTVEHDGKTLTPPAQKYIECIEDLLKVPIVLVGTGPADHQIILRKDVFSVKTSIAWKLRTFLSRLLRR